MCSCVSSAALLILEPSLPARLHMSLAVLMARQAVRRAEYLCGCVHARLVLLSALLTLSAHINAGAGVNTIETTSVSCAQFETLSPKFCRLLWIRQQKPGRFSLTVGP